MTEEIRWQLLEAAQSDNPGDEVHAERLATALLSFSSEEIESYGVWINQQIDALNTTNHYVVGVWIYEFVARELAIDLEMSADGWTYFRAWLFALGQRRYTTAAANPDVVAEYFLKYYTELHDLPNGELVSYSAKNAYRRKTNSDAPDTMFEPSIFDCCPGWPDGYFRPDNLSRKFPLCVAKLGEPVWANKFL